MNVPLPGIGGSAGDSIFFTNLKAADDVCNSWAADNIWPDCEDTNYTQRASTLHESYYIKQHLNDC